ncbi:MAG: hypothetical protein AAB670_02245 [Patescibacteria group bacterium]
MKGKYYIWETVVDFTDYMEGGIPIGDLLELLDLFEDGIITTT